MVYMKTWSVRISPFLSRIVDATRASVPRRNRWHRISAIPFLLLDRHVPFVVNDHYYQVYCLQRPPPICRSWRQNVGVSALRARIVLSSNQDGRLIGILQSGSFSWRVAVAPLDVDSRIHHHERRIVGFLESKR